METYLTQTKEGINDRNPTIAIATLTFTVQPQKV